MKTSRSQEFLLWHSSLRIQHCLSGAGLIPCPVQWVKDPALTQLQLRFNPWPRNVHRPQVRPLKKKKKKRIQIRAATVFGQDVPNKGKTESF